MGLDLALYQGKWQGLSLDADVKDVSVRLARRVGPLGFPSGDGAGVHDA